MRVELGKARRDEILSLARSGVPPLDISARLTVPPSAIYNVLKHARRRGELIPNFRSGRKRRPPKPLSLVARIAVWKAEDMEKLLAAAEIRQISPARVISAVVSKVIADGLIDAVLDDMDEAAHAH